MKKSTYLMSSLALILILLAGCTEREEFPVFRGPYLGQKPPGSSAELFAPGIITTSSDEAYPSFTRDGRAFHYKCRDKGGWLYMEDDGGRWSDPQIVPFSQAYAFGEAMIMPDGKTLLFCSQVGMKESEAHESYNLWRMDKHNGRWQTPTPFGIQINTAYHEAYPSISSSGDLYFFRELDDDYGGCEIFVARNDDDRWLTPTRLGSAVNSSRHDCDPFVAPNGRYLLFCVRDRDDGFGNNDLYISYKQADGSWLKSFNMGKAFNTSAEEITPYVTPDGRYIFFSSNRLGNYDIYWVDAKIIDTYKPELLK